MVKVKRQMYAAETGSNPIAPNAADYDLVDMNSRDHEKASRARAAFIDQVKKGAKQFDIALEDYGLSEDLFNQMKNPQIEVSIEEFYLLLCDIKKAATAVDEVNQGVATTRKAVEANQ